MLRVLRAFAWMRWRVLMNTIERTSARDTLERLSLAAEQIGPLVAIGLMAPSAVGFAFLGGYVGYALPEPGRVLTFDAVRVLLAIATGFCILGPIMMPSMERTSAVRLLLLPITRPTLYVAQSSGALTDPWILLAIPLMLGIPVGLAVAGALSASAIAVVAGALLVLTLIGLSALAAFVLHLIVRDRRRGELITLIVIMVLPLLGLLPGVLDASRTRSERRAERIARAERAARGEETSGERFARTMARAYTVLPSEQAARAIDAAADGRARASLTPLATLGLTAAALHGLAFLAFRRLLSSPGTTARRQTVADTSTRPTWIPGLSRAEAAVARAQVRLAFRTPRGRSLLISPVLVFSMLNLMLMRQREIDLGSVSLTGGLPLATFGSVVCLLSILPFAVNQFAIDRSGLTMALLSPIGTREYLIGKAVGNGLTLAPPVALCLLIALAMFRNGAPALWAALLLAVIATYAAAAPVAAALSAMFPRQVNLNSIGRGSNAHGLATFLGMLTVVGAALPSLALGAVAVLVLGSPMLALVLIAVWCGVALIVSRVLLGVVSSVFDNRRENLALVVR